MKFHRVLLFTTLQMDVTPVGEDLHVLLTSDNIPYIGCTALSTPVAESDPPACSTQTIESCQDASRLFITYVLYCQICKNINRLRRKNYANTRTKRSARKRAA